MPTAVGELCEMWRIANASAMYATPSPTAEIVVDEKTSRKSRSASAPMLSSRFVGNARVLREDGEDEVRRRDGRQDGGDRIHRVQPDRGEQHACGCVRSGPHDLVRDDDRLNDLREHAGRDAGRED